MKVDKLMTNNQPSNWFEKSHTEIFTVGDGVDSHYLKAFKLK
jgi:hypothetical protein